jgi:hypothetical protein
MRYVLTLKLCALVALFAHLLGWAPWWVPVLLYFAPHLGFIALLELAQLVAAVHWLFKPRGGSEV